MKKLPVYILAGGRGSRFGSDKARATLGGQPLLGHVAAMIEPVAAHIAVVADRVGKYDDLGFRTIADRRPGIGPLGGLDAALADLHGSGDWLLLCSCDALVIRSAWLTRLIGAITDDARHAVPVVRHQIEQDRRSMQELLDRLRTADLQTPKDWPEQWQANTPAALRSFIAESQKKG